MYKDDFELLFGLKVPTRDPHHRTLNFRMPSNLDNRVTVQWTSPGAIWTWNSRCALNYDKSSLFHRWMNLKGNRDLVSFEVTPEKPGVARRWRRSLYEIAKHEIHLSLLLRLFIIRD